MFIYVDDPNFPGLTIGIRVSSIKLFYTDPDAESIENSVTKIWLIDEDEPIDTLSSVDEIRDKLGAHNYVMEKGQ